MIRRNFLKSLAALFPLPFINLNAQEPEKKGVWGVVRTIEDIGNNVITSAVQRETINDFARYALKLANPSTCSYISLRFGTEEECKQAIKENSGIYNLPLTVLWTRREDKSWWETTFRDSRWYDGKAASF